MCVCGIFRVYAKEFTSFYLTSTAESDRILYKRFCRDGLTENVHGCGSVFSMNVALYCANCSDAPKNEQTVLSSPVVATLLEKKKSYSVPVVVTLLDIRKQF